MCSNYFLVHYSVIMRTNASQSDVTGSLGDFGLSWGVLGVSWRRLGEVLGGLGAILGGLGVVLGVPGALLAMSWEVLGGLGAILGRHFGLDKIPLIFDPIGCLKGGVWGTKMEPNRTQNETKNKIIFEMQKVTLQDRLGVVLGRFGRPPGSHFHCFAIGLCMILCKSTFSSKVGVQERSGCPKGSKRHDFGSQKWSLNR